MEVSLDKSCPSSMEYHEFAYSHLTTFDSNPPFQGDRLDIGDSAEVGGCWSGQVQTSVGGIQSGESRGKVGIQDIPPARRAFG